MKKVIGIILIILLTIALIMLVWKINIKEQVEMNIEYKKISFEDMDKIVEEKNLANYYILDVRTEEEYREKRLPNSMLIPNDEIERVEEEITDKDAYIFVYCRSGRRSQEAAIKMIEMGYTNVYDMGGIIDYTGETESM